MIPYIATYIAIFHHPQYTSLAIYIGPYAIYYHILHLFQINLDFLENSLEISMSGLLALNGLPSIITQQAHRLPHMRLLVVEMFNSIIGHSLFTKDAIFLELMQRFKGFMNDRKIEQYLEEAREIKAYLLVILHCATK